MILPVIVLSLLASAFGTYCTDCEKYCSCVKEREVKVDKPIEEVSAAVEKCLKDLEGSEMAEETKGISKFLGCRAADYCSCAREIEPVVAAALMTDKTTGQLQQKGKSRRKRAAADKDATELVSCCARELKLEDNEAVKKLLDQYRELEEAYMSCYEEGCKPKEEYINEADEKCGIEAGIAKDTGSKKSTDTEKESTGRSEEPESEEPEKEHSY